MPAQAKSVHGFGRSSTATTNTTQCPEISISCVPSEGASIDCGEEYWLVAANALEGSGSNSLRSSKGGSHTPESCTLIRKLASTPLILHKSRMRRRARTDLRRGRSVMVVPTATVTLLVHDAVESSDEEQETLMQMDGDLGERPCSGRAEAPSLV